MVRVYLSMSQDVVTDRLRLRRMELADAAAVRGLWLERDPRVPPRRRIDADGRPTIMEFNELLATQLAESDRTGLSTWVIERRSAPGFIGYCGLRVGGMNPDEPELVFEVARAWQGRGYATESARAILDAARATGRSKVWASVWDWNARSFRVLAKLGFTDSGQRDLNPDHGCTVWMTCDLDGQGRGSTRS
ncbi:GNAT family N-acetyltransferase [Demequina globuliformis]|uniref:GNAT family N-acetyltransferase n=1 Tax=Demequina globuliformis TaxID=676202 RepID=UPI000A729AFF|nr:GNAT family N-acetyltransferase [Demequina globuliformis]